MIHSEYSRAAKAAIEHVKRSVRYRGLNRVTNWIGDPLANPGLKLYAGIQNYRKGAERSAAYGGSFDAKRFIEGSAQLAIDTGTGNCGELSSIALLYLKEKDIAPLDYFGVKRGLWNHAFVILNRDDGIPVADFAAWSYQAVVCDPLYDRAADAGHLTTWYGNMFPLKKTDVWYRYA